MPSRRLTSLTSEGPPPLPPKNEVGRTIEIPSAEIAFVEESGDSFEKEINAAFDGLLADAEIFHRDPQADLLEGLGGVEKLPSEAQAALSAVDSSLTVDAEAALEIVEEVRKNAQDLKDEDRQEQEKAAETQRFVEDIQDFWNVRADEWHAALLLQRKDAQKDPDVFADFLFQNKKAAFDVLPDDLRERASREEDWVQSYQVGLAGYDAGRLVHGEEFSKKLDKLLAVVRHANSEPNFYGQFIRGAGLLEGERDTLALRLAQEHPEGFFGTMDIARLTLSADAQKEIGGTLLAKDPLLFVRAARELIVDQQTLERIIDEHPNEKIIEALGVSAPKVRMVSEPQEIGAPPGIEAYIDAARPPETWTPREFVERFEAFSDDVHDAVIEAYPQRREEEFRRRSVEDQLRGPIVGYGELGAGTATNPLFVLNEGRKIPSVHKPAVREVDRVIVDGHSFQLRQGIEAGTFFKREALVYTVDRIFGLGVVPVTVPRQGPEGLGSVQEWKIAKPASTVDWQTKVHPDSLGAVGVLDAITWNVDRHHGNLMIEADGTPVAIDNGLSFSKQPSERIGAGDPIRSEPLEYLNGSEVPIELQHRLASVLTDEKLLGLLRQAFEFTFATEKMPDGRRAAQPLFDAFLERVRSLAADDSGASKHFPQPAFRFSPAP